MIWYTSQYLGSLDVDVVDDDEGDDDVDGDDGGDGVVNPLPVGDSTLLRLRSRLRLLPSDRWLARLCILAILIHRGILSQNHS